MGIFKKNFLVLFLLILLPAVSHAQTALININTASSEELQTLNGIGPAYAQRIIDYRTANGLFAKIEDIKNVSGIGDVTFSKIKDLITIGEASTSPVNIEENTSQTSTQTTQTSSSQRSSSNTVTVSAHYSATPVSDLETESKFEVSAGRDRLGITGSPLEFKVETNVKYTRGNIFKWNFGDGTVGYGITLNHTYEYPGEYAVVLNGSFSEGQAVARVNVKIIEPEIAVTLATPERIELKNGSKYEVSLFGRALVSNGKVFIFPQDTIIKAGQSVSFSTKITSLRPNGLYDVDVLIIGESVVQPNLVTKIEEQKLNKIATIRNEIAVLRQKMAGISPPAPSLVVQELSEPIEETEPTEPEEIKQLEPQTAIAKEGWLSVLKRFFLRTR